MSDPDLKVAVVGCLLFAFIFLLSAALTVGFVVLVVKGVQALT